MSPIETGLRYHENLYLLISVLLFGLFARSAIADPSRELEILGWLEHARLINPEVHLNAKLDSGAETSSLDAVLIKKFRKGDKSWVRFRMLDRETGREHIIVRERVRNVAIVMHDGDRQARPVVRMKICIAGRILDTEVSLVDRSEFTYPLLLGRRSLESIALIDPGNTYLSTTDCTPQHQEKSAGG